MKRGHRLNRAGFTLLEVIIIICLCAVLGAFLIQFTGTGLIGSAKTLHQVRDDFDMVDVMERITRDYRAWISTTPGPLTEFETQVLTNYAAVVVPGQTGIVNLRGDDDPNSVLQVTVARGDWKLTTLFTR